MSFESVQKLTINTKNLEQGIYFLNYNGEVYKLLKM
jgi:hypothetical protein